MTYRDDLLALRAERDPGEALEAPSAVPGAPRTLWAVLGYVLALGASWAALEWLLPIGGTILLALGLVLEAVDS